MLRPAGQSFAPASSIFLQIAAVFVLSALIHRYFESRITHLRKRVIGFVGTGRAILSCRDYISELLHASND
jgi:peptidoglycan/LPS O-acetylase OafA/YrhL